MALENRLHGECCISPLTNVIESIFRQNSLPFNNLRSPLNAILPGALSRAIARHNATSAAPIHALRVGDPLGLPLATGDPDILLWAEREGHVVITLDERTMPVHLLNHLANGGHLPGVFIIRARSRLREVLDFLIEAADTGDDDQWRDQLVYIP